MEIIFQPLNHAIFLLIERFGFYVVKNISIIHLDILISLFKDIISPELPKGSSILITDIESELSDATNANNHVKFKWKTLRKQVPFTVPRLHNIFNQVYNNTFD